MRGGSRRRSVSLQRSLIGEYLIFVVRGNVKLQAWQATKLVVVRTVDEEGAEAEAVVTP